MTDFFDEETFHGHVQSCIDRVKLLLRDEKSATSAYIAPAIDIPHKYVDKYTLAEQIVNITAACIWNAFFALGLTSEQYEQIQSWEAQGNVVSMRFHHDHKWTFIKETTRDETDTTEFQLSGILKTKVITKITEYHHSYAGSYRISFFRGVGAAPEDFITINERTLHYNIISLIKNLPAPSIDNSDVDVNLSWLMKMTSSLGGKPALSFSINRNHEKCYTPRRNPEILDIDHNMEQLNEFSYQIRDFICDHLIEVESLKPKENRTDFGSVLDSKERQIFTPVFPVLRNFAEDEDRTISAREAAEGASRALIVRSDEASVVCMSSTDIAALVEEQMRSLLASISDMNPYFPGETHSEFREIVVTVREARLALIASHLSECGRCSNCTVYLLYM